MAAATQEFVIPFWLVGSSPEAAKANMMFKVATTNQGGAQVAIPVLVNCKDIQMHEPLIFYRPPGAKGKYHLPDNMEDLPSKKRARKAA